MRITAKADYAVRAAVELAAAEPGVTIKGEKLATAQHIPLNFLENILRELRRAGIVYAQRGSEGGYRLAMKPENVTLADIIRAVEGPLAAVQGIRPDQLEFEGTAEPLVDVWIAVRAALRSVLERTTLADVASGKLPAEVQHLAAAADSWSAH